MILNIFNRSKIIIPNKWKNQDRAVFFGRHSSHILNKILNYVLLISIGNFAIVVHAS